MYKRELFNTLIRRLSEPRRFIQVLAGPRQAGKTTLVRQVMEDRPGDFHYATADEPEVYDRGWIERQWDRARAMARAGASGRSPTLVLDEIHKVADWSRLVKLQWDADTASGLPLRVVLLGSSPLLLQRGLTESLAGRFETIAVPHWSFREMHDAFGWGAERFLFYGAYPGAAPLADDASRWARYIIDSLIETTLARDVLLLRAIHKPALLRQLFVLGCRYSGQELSFQKMLGQLHDAGNTTTLAHYLELLSGAGMIAGLSKYSARPVRARASSPKLLAQNTALVTATSGLPFAELRRDPERWGRLAETAVGAHLWSGAAGTPIEVFYWRERGDEVDYVLRRGETLVAIEVKSGRPRPVGRGLAAFERAHHPSRTLLVGVQGMPIEEFLSTPVPSLFPDTR